MAEQSWQEQAKEKFPAWAPLLDIPDVADVLRQAVDGGWSSTIFATHLQATNWWKTTSSSQRQWLVLSVTDPATARQQMGTQAEQVAQLAQRQGIHLPVLRLFEIASNAMAGGWNSEQIQNELLKNVNGELSGELGSHQQLVEDMARKFAIPMSDQTSREMALKLAAGTASQDSIQADFSRQAAMRFRDPSIQEALAAGQSIAEYASPYVNTAAGLLGINPSSIDLRQPKWGKALDAVDAKGNRRALTLGEFEDLIRTDQSYGYQFTDAAHADAAQLAGSIRQAFGKL